MEDNSDAKCPFTKTSRLPASVVKADPFRISEADLSFAPSSMGLNGRPAIGATFVKRQSSSLSVGKPCSAKQEMPALRSGKSHAGWFVCFSNRSKFLRYESVPFSPLSIV